MDMLELFPTYVFTKQCNLDLVKIKRECLEHADKVSSSSMSSSGYQHYDFICNDLSKELKYSIPQREDLPLKSITSSFWVNINYRNQYNVLHSHDPFQNNALSGVFYVQANENSGNIKLFDPRFTLTSAPDLKYYNNSSSSFYFTPKPNFLIIFPSRLQHLVEPNHSDEERISISFNIQLDY